MAGVIGKVGFTGMTARSSVSKSLVNTFCLQEGTRKSMTGGMGNVEAEVAAPQVKELLTLSL